MFLGIDYWKVLRLVLGIVLYFSAEKLSRNTMFYYICGVSFGIGASFLILIYFLSKLFPKVSVFVFRCFHFYVCDCSAL